MNKNRIWVLYGKKIAAEASSDELKELNLLLEADKSDGGHLKSLEKILQLPIEHQADESDFESSWNQLSSNIILQSAAQTDVPQERQPFVVKFWKQLTIAASIVLFAVGFLLTKEFHLGKNTQFAQNEIATKAGSRTNIILPDGTKVWLNAGSKLVYNKDFAQNREVSLVGEAFFDVAHQENNPFILSSASIKIKVLGTAFNVRAYPKENKIETSLLRGSIELTTTYDPERKILLRPNEKISISASNSTSASTPNLVKKNIYNIEVLSVNPKIRTINETAWMEEKLVFTSETLKKLAERMETWYGVEIKINDPLLADLKFTGVFDRLNIVEAIQTLQFSCDEKFIYQINKDSIIIKAPAKKASRN